MGGGGTGGGGAGGAQTDAVSTPSVEFEVTQETVFYCDGNDHSANLTTLYLTHASGDDLDTRKVRVRVAGNASTWGLDQEGPFDTNPEQPDCGGLHDRVEPVPDVRLHIGSNQLVTFDAGEERDLYATEGVAFDNIERYRYEFLYNGSDNPEGFNRIQAFHEDLDGPKGYPPAEEIESGDELVVEWTASSGDEAATLFEYTVE
jgi:hypothetical protein